MTKQRKKQKPESRNKLLLGVALLAALIVRVLFWLQSGSDPFANITILDAHVYQLLAQEIAGGHFWGSEVFFRAPLFPYLLGVVYIIFGVGLQAIKAVQLLLGLGTVLLTYEVAHPRFGAKIAGIAAIIAGLYPTLYFFESQLMPTTLTVFTAMLALYWLTRFEYTHKMKFLLLGGVAVGLSALARPVGLAFLVLAPLWLWSLTKRDKLKVTAKHFVVLLVGTFVVILPVTIRNYSIEPDFVLISSQGGANFYIGNNPDADGLTVKFPQSTGQLNKYEDHIWSHSTILADQAEHRKLTAAEVSSYWQSRGMEYVKEHPGRALELLFERVYYFLAGEELFNNRNPLEVRQYATLYGLTIWDFGLSFPYGLLVPFFLIGVFVAIRSRKPHWLLLLFVLSQIAATSLFFVCSRFRQPVIPVMIMFAVLGATYLYQLLSKRQWKNLAAYLVALLLLVFALNPPGHLGSRENESLYHSNLAGALEKQNRNEEAIAQLETALKVAPDNASAWVFLGTINAKLHQFEKAEQALRQAEKIAPNDTRTTLLLGRVNYDQGKYAQALPYFERLIAAGGSETPLLYSAARSAVAVGEPEKACVWLQQLLRNNPGAAPAQQLRDSLDCR